MAALYEKTGTGTFKSNVRLKAWSSAEWPD